MRTLKKYTFLFIICLLVLCISSCKKNVQQKYERKTDAELIKYTNQNVEELSFDVAANLFSQMEVVKLETTSKSLLGQIRQIETMGDDIFVYDWNKNLLRFSKENGAFLNRIGTVGQGPEEYYAVNGFSINKKNKTIVVIDVWKRKFIKYNFDGNYISSTEASSEFIRDISYSMHAPDNSILINNVVHQEPFNAYTSVNMESNQYENFFSYKEFGKRDCILDFSTHPMASFEDGINFIMPVENVIYEYKNGKIQTKYEIEIPVKMINKQSVVEHEMLLIVAPDLIAAYSNVFPGFKTIFQTKEKMILTFSGKGAYKCFIVIDKKTNEGTYYNYSTIPDCEIPCFEIFSCSDDYFVSCINTENIAQWKSELQKNKYDVKNDKLKDLILNAKFDDNPSLVFYK